MQGLLAISGAQCSVFGQLPRLRNTDAAQAVLRFHRRRIVSTKLGQYSECKAWVAPNQYLWKPDWRCCASVSVEDGIATEELNPLLTKESSIPAIDVDVPEGPSVQVKFVLQKKCKFGQNFNVVGNHPLFGSWNPEAAIPMSWADGHLWSVEVDVPIEKQIEFKFVLTGEDAEIEWQPGPNNLFETVEDASPLIVTGVWESEDEQELESPSELDSQKEDSSPIATEELSNVAGIGSLIEAAKEEITTDLASMAGLVEAVKEKVKLEEVNGLPISSNFSSVESTGTSPEVLLANAAPVSGTVQAASENNYPV